jgi:IS1 family transposase
MNRLSTQERAAIATALVEGNSIRATCRMTGAAKGTVTRLLVDLGAACADYQDAVLRDLPCTRVQADEIWAFVGSKERNVPLGKRGQRGRGDVWTWTAICRDSKLVPSWLVGLHTPEDAALFMSDLASRMAGRIQLTTDGHKLYMDAVALAFGQRVDYAQLVKTYDDPSTAGRRRYSPSRFVASKRHRVSGHPIEADVSTSHVERCNLTMRMGMRRFTRLTNGFSKKIENLDAAVALHFAYYNLACPHASLHGRTPAQAAGVSKYRWMVEDLVGLLDADVRLAPTFAPVRPRD